jgi:hypothetical protein
VIDLPPPRQQAADVSASWRSLSVACYLGLSPLIPASRRADPFVAHHHAQAMAVLFLFVGWFVMVLLLDVLEWIGLMNFPNFGEHQLRRLEMYVGYAAWVLFAVLGTLWVGLLVLALTGSGRHVPWLQRIARKRWIIRFSFITNAVGLALIPVIAVLGIHAVSLTRTNGQAAAVYFLYDEGIPVPRWGYALWMYRVSWQAQRNWGRGSIVLDRLNRETLRAGLAHARVVILATHGGSGYACTWYAPEKLGVFPPATRASDAQGRRFLRASILGAHNKWGEMENVPVHGGLQLVYMFGCDVGKKASQWQKHLAPAQVITYDRWSTVFDHACWFGLTGPARLKTLQ